MTIVLKSPQEDNPLATYLAYDIRGIQRFIFAIPKLKAIIGGSAMIDGFDQYVVEQTENVPGAEVVFAGGGRGIIKLGSSDSVNQLERKLVKRAHFLGLDLQVGDSENIRVAVNGANRLHTYIPESLEGVPCNASGILPVSNSETAIHPLIRKRMQEGRKDRLGERLLTLLQNRIELPEVVSGCQLKFFRDVNPKEAENDTASSEDIEEARFDVPFAVAGKRAMGSRNRWAVIAMDGNSLGSQFDEENATPSADYDTWLKEMSSAVKRCTMEALLNALKEAIQQWLTDEAKRLEQFVVSGNGQRFLVLPFRPLILGGDDILMLAHCKYALQVVRNLTNRFHELSCKEAKQWKKGDLWPATENALTMSASILFTSTTMPLHTSIEYAESLLANAKSKYRNVVPMPAALDFEAVTESLLDSPTERRRRELQFIDIDLNQEIHLSRRPFLLKGDSVDSVDKLYELVDALTSIPGSLRSQLLPMMRQVWSERYEFLASIAKNHPKLVLLLRTELAGEPSSAWTSESPKVSGLTRLTTSLADALMVIDEEDRIAQGEQQR
jgi:hypothetical protein